MARTATPKIKLKPARFAILEPLLLDALAKAGARVQQAAKGGNIPAIAEAAASYQEIDAMLMEARSWFTDDPADDEGEEEEDRSWSTDDPAEGGDA
jgi:hypothetical protein